VEFGPRISEAFLPSTNLPEVLSSPGDHLVEQLHVDPAKRNPVSGHIKVHFGSLGTLALLLLACKEDKNVAFN